MDEEERVGADAGAPAPDAEDESEQVARVAAGEQDREPSDHDAHHGGDAEKHRAAIYDYRKRRLAARAGKIDDEENYEDRSMAWQQMIQLVLTAQRHELLRLRDDGQLSNEATNRILRELDLEESRLEI